MPQVGRRPPRRQGPVIAAVLLLVALVAAGGTAAFLLLPNAEIVLVPAAEPVGPFELNVTAQAGVTQPDPVNLLVPATRFTFDVDSLRHLPVERAQGDGDGGDRGGDVLQPEHGRIEHDPCRLDREDGIRGSSSGRWPRSSSRPPRSGSSTTTS